MKFRFGSKRHKSTLHVKGLIPGIINELKINDQMVLESLRADWPVLVGEILATHSKPGRIFKNTLFVTVDHSIYANELSLVKDRIMALIEKETAPGRVSNIRFEVSRVKWNNSKEI